MLLALLIATAAQVPVFSDPVISEALGGFRPQPGAWVEYAILPSRGSQVRLKASVLPPPMSEGRYWLEIVTEQQGGVPVALKMLLRGPPERAENVERAYLYVAGQAPAELPVEDFQRAPRPASPKSRQVKRAGRKDLVLAAGRFRCDVLRVEGARLYRSGQVPLWGMVRAVTREQRVELVGFGDVGAVSVFPPGFDQGKGSESAK